VANWPWTRTDCLQCTARRRCWDSARRRSWSWRCCAETSCTVDHGPCADFLRETLLHLRHQAARSPSTRRLQLTPQQPLLSRIYRLQNLTIINTTIRLGVASHVTFNRHLVVNNIISKQIYFQHHVLPSAVIPWSASAYSFRPEGLNFGRLQSLKIGLSSRLMLSWKGIIQESCNNKKFSDNLRLRLPLCPVTIGEVKFRWDFTLRPKSEPWINSLVWSNTNFFSNSKRMFWV